MSLRKKQTEFARLIPRLIDKAFELGFEVTLGDAYRDPRVHGAMGEKKSYSAISSNHKIRLAIDLNLFKDGRYIADSEGHAELGAWWEAQHAAARWGGRFQDPNHYEFKNDGAR
jgi:hypothetical protein